MKNLLVFPVSIAIIGLLNSCINANANQGSSKNITKNSIDQELKEISLTLNSKSEESQYHLSWNSNLPRYGVSYNININGKVVKSDITRTEITDNGTTFEFNIPDTEYRLSKEELERGDNIVQVIAIYNDVKIISSNSVRLSTDSNKISELAVLE